MRHYQAIRKLSFGRISDKTQLASAQCGRTQPDLIQLFFLIREKWEFIMQIWDGSYASGSEGKLIWNMDVSGHGRFETWVEPAPRLRLISLNAGAVELVNNRYLRNRYLFSSMTLWSFNENFWSRSSMGKFEAPKKFWQKERDLDFCQNWENSSLRPRGELK